MINNYEIEEKNNKKKYKNFFNKENSLANFIIPFIDSYVPVSAFHELYLRYEQYKRNYTEDMIKSNSSMILFVSPEKDKKTNECIDENQLLIKQMIETAFSIDEVNEDKYKEIEKKIDVLLKGTSIIWRKKGNIGKKPDLKLETIVLNNNEFTLLTAESAKDLFRVIIKALISAFDSFNSKKPIGYDYIGKCQCCGKLFIKGRKDQIYCSNKCNNKIKQINFREKHMNK